MMINFENGVKVRYCEILYVDFCATSQSTQILIIIHTEGSSKVVSDRYSRWSVAAFRSRNEPKRRHPCLSVLPALAVPRGGSGLSLFDEDDVGGGVLLPNVCMLCEARAPPVRTSMSSSECMRRSLPSLEGTTRFGSVGDKLHG